MAFDSYVLFIELCFVNCTKTSSIIILNLMYCTIFLEVYEIDLKYESGIKHSNSHQLAVCRAINYLN